MFKLVRLATTLLITALTTPIIASSDSLPESAAMSVRSTLWSDEPGCASDDGLFIAIDDGDTSFKVALCAIHGCRIATREFGKTNHPGNVRLDPRFIWHSESEFEAQINGKLRRMYRCS